MNSDFIALADEAFGKLEYGLDVVGEYAYMFVQAEKGSGLGLAKLLHQVNFHWKNVEHEPSDTFEDWALRSTGRDKATIQRRVCTWEFLKEYVPPQYEETFLKNWNISMFSRGYRVAVKHKRNKHTGNYDLISSGNEIEPSEWLALSECVDSSMLIEQLDKITKKEPNKNRVSFGYRDGELWFYRGKKEQAVIGSLFDGSESELVQDGITEVLEKLGVK